MEHRNPFAGGSSSEQTHDGSMFTGETGQQDVSSRHHLYANNHGAETSISFAESSASLVDPVMLELGPEQRLLRRSQKFVPPIQIPGSSGSSGRHLSPHSPAIRSALTDAFPLPPPRTPITPSHSAASLHSAYSPSQLLHTHGHRPSESGSSNSAGPDSPRVHLSVPPPSPNAYRLSGQSGYRDADISSLRDAQSQSSAGSPIFSPGPAHERLVKQHDGAARAQSMMAELSSQYSASPRHPPVAYPPAAYSPKARNGSLPPLNSRHDSPTFLAAAAAGQMALPPSPASTDRREYVSRRESAGTFGTAQSSQHSFGMNGVLNTLEYEGFGFQSDASPSSSGHRPSFSDGASSFTSSPGHTHQLVRMGDILEARPAASSGVQESSRRLRASLVSSQLLRSASSMDALKSVLQEAPPVDRPGTSLRPPVRPRHSSRYSSGPAPTLASLAEDGDYNTDGQAELLPDRQRQRKQRTYSLSSSKRVSDWASRSLKSASSHKSRRSSATHFTVASQAPTVPSLNNHRKRAEIAERESKMPIRNLAKRASTLSQLLDHKPSQGRYISSHSGIGEDTDDLDELRFSSQRLKAKKVGFGIPGMWSAKGGGEGTGPGEMRFRMAEQDGISEISTQDSRFADPVIEPSHFRRRRSYPANQLNEAIHGQEKYEPYDNHANHRNNSSSFSSNRTIPAPAPFIWYKSLTSSKRKRLMLLLLFLAVLIIVLGVLGGTVFKKHPGAGGVCSKTCLNGGRAVADGDSCSCSCTGGFVRSFCQLDPTCTCPNGSDTCDFKLAKSVLRSASYASTIFTPAVNASRLATAMHLYLPGNGELTDCSAQSRLLDLPNLDPSTYKSRQRWTQAVLLWDMASSEDFGNSTLREFQNSLNYWQWQDSPSFQAQPTFQATSHGYTIDFAYEKVLAPQKDIEDADLTAVQATRLDNTSSTALERMLAFSTAASTQRSTPLERLFTELGFSPDQLNAFRTAIQAAPVLFPFDISGQIGTENTMDLAFRAQASGQTFPPPLACQSGLPTADLNSLDHLENGVFGLPDVSAHDNCTASSRPTYGVLDLLGLPILSLPSATHQPGQAVAIVNSDVKRRMTFHAGQLLSGIPFGSSANINNVTADAFGTFDNLDAVILAYLNQLDKPTKTTDLVTFVLQSSSVSLPLSLLNLPIMEVQLWGELPFSDVDYITSSIASPAGSPIFGTALGNSLRTWAHSSQNRKPIRWALNETSADSSLDNGNDPKFQQVWDSSANLSEAAVYEALQNNGLLSL